MNQVVCCRAGDKTGRLHFEGRKEKWTSAVNLLPLLEWPAGLQGMPAGVWAGIEWASYLFSNHNRPMVTC